MSKAYFFSEVPPDETINFFRLVIADSMAEAEQMVLDPETDSFHSHLTEQMRPGGTYSHVATIEEALREYFPYVIELPLEKGLLMRAGNGWAHIVPEPSKLLRYK